MDFIIKLLKSKNSMIKTLYGSIIIVIDKLTKYIHFILFKTNFNTKQLKQFFID